MSKLFDDCDSDNEVDIITNNNYAKAYDNWRQKEEFNKLKTKYGSEVLELNDDSSSSSDDDDDDGAQLTEEVEKEFFKTLSSLKNKDPKIYDANVTFFKDLPVVVPNAKKTQDRPVYIKDYERNIILENDGRLSDSETENDRLPTYVEEQNNLKQSFKNALENVDDDNEEAWGGLFKTREKTTEEEKQDDDEYKRWLLGQKEQITDKEIESDLKPLKDYWSNPQLAENEKFLRDYVLNKGFLTKDNRDHIPTYHEIVRDSEEELSEDETEVAKQEEFEYKYNYRFEEPDQEFIKRYPRTMENSLRKVDDRRKIKRAEVKERKQKDKELKMAEIRQMQALKKKEIEEKISKLKEITGSTDVAFDDQDIDGDFDPELHDKRMGELFDGEFYGGAEGDQKPEFPDLDEELEIENWEKCDDVKDLSETIEEPHCEDNEFNMDCDYNPTADDDIKTSKTKKKHRRKSKFAKAVSEPKPVFDPADKTYEKYLDEYYKLDCEDVIGDIPCRFKYRHVTPNNFGLSIEEILLAKDRELNRWCSLKKAVQYRPENVEKYDVVAFDKKGKNDTLKRKLLPSLFSEEEIDVNAGNVCSKEGNTCKENITVEVTVPSTNKQVENSLSHEKNLKKRKIKNVPVVTVPSINKQVESSLPHEKNSKKKKRKIKNVPVAQNDNTAHKSKRAKVITKKSKSSENSMGISDARLTAYGFKPKKFNNKLKYGSISKQQNK